MKNDILEDSSRMKANPFIVPEGYFRRMEEQASLARRKRRTTALAPLLSLAAAAAVLIAGIWTWSEKRTDEVQNAVQMSDDEIVAYLIYSGVEIEEIEIHEVEH